jgi:hypothetical protein
MARLKPGPSGCFIPNAGWHTPTHTSQDREVTQPICWRAWASHPSSMESSKLDSQQLGLRAFAAQTQIDCFIERRAIFWG